METEKKIVLTKDQENIKPSFLQKLSGYLVDICLVFLLYWGAFYVCMHTPISSSFDYYNLEVIDIQDDIKLKTGFGEKVLITDENKAEYATYYIHTDSDNQQYVVVNVDNVSQSVTLDYQEELNNSKVYKTCVFNRRLALYGINVLSGFVSTSILLLAVPLLNKRRATLGQLAGEEMLYSIRFDTKAHWYHVLFRYLFIFIIEGCLPFLFFELYTFILMPIIYLLVSSLNKNGMTLHDVISRVRVIDKRSYTPIVQDSDVIDQEVNPEDEDDEQKNQSK